MPLSFSVPDVTASDAEQLLLATFGVRGTCLPLEGERDRNFLVRASDDARFVFKVCNAGEDHAFVELQCAVLQHLRSMLHGVETPHTITTASGDATVVVPIHGVPHILRLLSWIDGKPLATTRPQSPHLLHSLGAALGEVSRSLRDFSHPAARRTFKWDLPHAGWVLDEVHHIDDVARRARITRHMHDFADRILPSLRTTRTSIIHGDANDWNVLTRCVAGEPDARVVGLIDFGDLVESHTVCELAVALAYAMMDKPDPLSAAADVVSGFHAEYPLTDGELALLLPLVRTRLSVTVTNAALQRVAQPGNHYLSVSEQGAWTLLDKLDTVNERYAHYRLRHACGLAAVPASAVVAEWLTSHRSLMSPIVEVPLDTPIVPVLDLSVGSDELGTLDEWRDVDRFTQRLFDELRHTGAPAAIGRYDEVRALYTSDAFSVPGNDGPEYRAVHIGLDVFLQAGAPVFAPLAGRVHSRRDNAASLDYGPTIILEHVVDDGRITFYTLYGHLSRASLEHLRPGQEVSAGAQIATLGDQRENGGWPPHLHFQIICDLLGREGEFPGVARARERDLWLSVSPDPALMVALPSTARAPRATDIVTLLARRRAHMGPSLSISYRHPMHMVRGVMQYLVSIDGRRYLDAVNNVPHVGHSHPHVVRAGARRMATLNTNTRYLHDDLVRYAERLTATLPETLSVCYFVCSGSEANEVALRLAAAHTGERDVVVVDAGYHGNTSTLVDVSSYKFDGPGGAGAPPWVHKVPMPDTYRGPFGKDDPKAGWKYAQGVRDAVGNVLRAGRRPRAFLAESILSCGGQIVLPDGYLAEAYRHVRDAGGVCIADEVQVGFGRVGTHFWAFETQGVVPDIVTMGKPIGNGHPMAAVVTTPDIAASFANGMEFFSTFGGNPVSCAIGLAVLDVVESEGLQAHALRVGDHLIKRLAALMTRFPLVGDVRGLGLFLGVEMVNDRAHKGPATRQAWYVANRMKDGGVLMSTDGPFNNVLKIKPPMCFTLQDADFLVETMARVLTEDGAQPAP